MLSKSKIIEIIKNYSYLIKELEKLRSELSINNHSRSEFFLRKLKRFERLEKKIIEFHSLEELSEWKLSDREWVFLDSVLSGKTIRETAMEQGYSPRMGYKHLDSIAKKMFDCQ